jgi:hypothetical protein
MKSRNGISRWHPWTGVVIAALCCSAGSMAVRADTAWAMRLLRANCLGCHNESKHKGGLMLHTREAMMKGGSGGQAVVEGRPGDSPLVSLLSADADPHMPPRKQLAVEDMAVLSDWVQAGAPWDAAALEADDGLLRPVNPAALPAAYRPVMAMALAPDGSKLAVGWGREVLVFSVGDGPLELRHRGEAHPDPVQSLAWSSDGRQLVSGAFRRLVVWGLEPWGPQREIREGLTDRIAAVRLLPGSSQAVLADGLAGERGTVRVVDTADGTLVRSWKAHDDSLFALELAEGGRLAVTAGGDRMVKFWEVATGRETMRIEAHGSQVLGLDLNDEGTQLVTGGADRQLKVWDVKTRESTVTLTGRSAAVNAVQWQGTNVLAAGDDGALGRLSDLKPHTGAQSSETGNEKSVGKAPAPIFCVAALPDGRRIFAGTADGKIFGWNQDGKQTDQIDPAAPAAP